MRGSEHIGATVRAAIVDALGDKIAEIRDRLDLSESALVAPDASDIFDHPFPPLEAERWPFIVIVPQSVTDTRVVDVTLTGTEYELTYPVRVFAFVRGQEYDDTNLAIQRTTLALRECILSMRLASEDIKIDPRSLRESYAEVDDETERRTIGASYVEFSLTATETLEDTGTVPATSTEVLTELL